MSDHRRAHSHRVDSINGFGGPNDVVIIGNNDAADFNFNQNAKSDQEKASPYHVPDSPEVQKVKETLHRIANQGSVKAVMVLDPNAKMTHLQYPTSGIVDFDARHMKLDDFKLLVAQADDFVRDINPRSFLKTLRMRGKNTAMVMEFEEDKNSVCCVQRTKFVPLVSKNHI